MKILAVIMAPLVLTGCFTTATPVKRSFPEAPAYLMQPADELRPLDKNTQDLDALIINANENYASYRELDIRLQGWQQWYREQKQIFESVK
jgi:hypothetical protein